MAKLAIRVHTNIRSCGFEVAQDHTNGHKGLGLKSPNGIRPMNFRKNSKDYDL